MMIRIIFRYHFDALAEANDAEQSQDHIVDRIESIPIDSLNVQQLVFLSF